MSERKYEIADFAKDGADRDLRLLGQRIPIITSHYPWFNYVTALVITQGKPDFGAEFVNPTDEELAMVASFHEEYISHWYREGWLKQMRERLPFDVDGGANGRFLGKYTHGGWAIKARTWHHGPKPLFKTAPMSLLQVLDWHHTSCDEVSLRWTTWKKGHPDVFGGAS
ncbi:hypothetical protein [Amycolatopsis japonica]